MPIDTPASGSGKPRRNRRQALLYDQAGRRERVVDDQRFAVAAGGLREATFRLQLFTAPGLRPVAVVTQVVPAEGAGTVNHAERYAEAIWRTHLPEEPRPPILIGRMLLSGGFGMDDVDEPRDLGLKGVDFRVADASEYRVVRPPVWGPQLTLAELEYLVGQSVDVGRGAYVAPPALPGPVERFEVRAVVLLPRADLDDPECMPGPTPWWRRVGRQVAPRRRGRDCCWYHAGDWQRVTVAAIGVLRRAQGDPGGGDVYLRMVELARELPLTEWEHDALDSLFLDPIVVAERELRAVGVGYNNGRHRAQAMLDAGVRRTVVVVVDWPTGDPVAQSASAGAGAP